VPVHANCHETVNMRQFAQGMGAGQPGEPMPENGTHRAGSRHLERQEQKRGGLLPALRAERLGIAFSGSFYHQEFLARG
jgi:hypothetical protein